MNPALITLLGEMIDTVAESNPGLARAWHKLLEASCSDDCSAGSGGTATVSGVPRSSSDTTTSSDEPASPVVSPKSEKLVCTADSPPPVPEFMPATYNRTGDNAYDNSGCFISRLAAEDHIAALTANRDWWRKRAEELEKRLTAPRTFHRCKGRIRPYPSLVCSASPHHADSDNFDPVTEIERLEQQVAQQMAIRPSVASFASMMENTLRKHDAKKGGQANWRKDTHEALLRRLHAEIDEVDDAVLQVLSGDSTTEDVVKELVDVANFAMMCVDVLHPLACDSITPPSVTAGAEVREVRPCGCIPCVCDDPIRCHGCGAKWCDEHERMYATPPEVKP